MSELTNKIELLKKAHDALVKDSVELVTIQEGLLKDNSALENRLKEVKKEKKKMAKSNDVSMAKLKRDVEVAYSDMVSA